ncbi:MAG: helix-turn-helix domain-containing protein [Candidatus Hydrogenedentes bacterium]|nr:helix-turn-helix domain-containing protein [Candidatus Hydrogenedentota bacterium]
MSEQVRLLTRQQAAEKLLISLRTLHRLAAEGALVGARMGGHRVVFREIDVERYIEKQFQKAAN